MIIKTTDNHRAPAGREPLSRSPGRGADAMTQSYEMAGRNVASNLAEKQPHELLLLLGGALAILLSVMLYAIQWAQGGIPASRLASETTTFVIVLVLGAALWASAAVSRKNLMNGAIVAGVVSIVLIAYGGGLAGTIGGVIGLLGAILAAANPYLPWSRHT